MEVDGYEDGVPGWVDLGTPDPARAAAFYEGLFGWDCPEGPAESGGYRVCTFKGRFVAGLGHQQNPGPPVWATYVIVADADAAVARAIAHGASVLAEPFDVMDAGRMAVLADPNGAVISVWQAGMHRGAGIVNEPNTYSWSELVTSDVAGSIAFYEAVFGWTHVDQGEGEHRYTEWRLGSRSIGGMMQRPPTMPAAVPDHWAVYFTVEDADASAARVAELGGSVMMPPTDIEPGRMAAVADDQGSMFNILQPKEGLNG